MYIMPGILPGTNVLLTWMIYLRWMYVLPKVDVLHIVNFLAGTDDPPKSRKISAQETIHLIDINALLVADSIIIHMPLL